MNTGVKPLARYVVLIISMLAALNVFAAENLEIDTPGITAIKQIMQARHPQLAGYYASGAIGLTSDGMLGLRDLSAVPLSAHYSLNALVAAENRDRDALYAEIARANGHPEWESQIRNIFAERWMQRAQPGWWVQTKDGWKQK